MSWKDYELEIHNHFKELFPNADISHNITLTGRYSKVQRQIDVLIEDYIAGSRMRIVIDGKFFSKNIDVKHVEMFLGMLNDCEANKGLLITQEGYSKAAINRAYYDQLDIDLDILNFKELQEFQGLMAIPYSGKHSVVLPSPFGWIIDATKRPNMLATLYQRGLTLQEAGENKEWMYINIKSKDNEIETLEDFLNHQKNNTLKQFPEANITYLPTVKRADATIKLRSMEIISYPTIEYTGFVDFDKFIFFCVLFTPEELKKKNLRKLEYVLQSVLPIAN